MCPNLKKFVWMMVWLSVFCCLDAYVKPKKGYTSSLVVWGRALSASELNDLGAAKQNFLLQPNAQQLQQRIQRHLHL